MIEYYDVYRKSINSFNGNNPRNTNKPEIINFKIKLLNKKLSISISNDESLEDLYTHVYNAVYPEFSTEKTIDVIPTIGISNVPRIYNISLVNEKTETIHTIPLHKFITISSYMKSNPGSFVSTSIFGQKFYTIYVIDEFAIENCANKNNKTLFQMIFSCYYSKNIDPNNLH